MASRHRTLYTKVVPGNIKNKTFEETEAGKKLTSSQRVFIKHLYYHKNAFVEDYSCFK